MTPADFEHEAVEFWPDNLDAVHLFLKMDTQWRAGPGGLIGLDYTVLFRLLDRMQLDGNRWDELFADIATMEAAALEEMHRKD